MNIGAIRLAVFCGFGGIVAAGLTPAPLRADPSNTWDSLMDRSTLTGDWGGVRTELADNGISFFGDYLSMFADNVSGGEKQTNTYGQQLALGVNLDLAKMSPDLIGQVKFLTSSRDGNSLSSGGVGNYVPVQAIVGGGVGFRIVNMSYSVALNNGRTFVNVGFLPLGDNYAAIQDFINLQSDAFNEHAAGLYTGRGWTDFPIGHWGGMVKQYLLPDLYGQIGAWDVNPDNEMTNHMVYFSTMGSTGVIIPAQFGFHTHLGGLDLPGDYVIGGYYDTSTTPDVVNPENPRQGRFGGYAYLTQAVYKNSNDPKRTLSLFAEVVGADSKTATIPAFYALGLIDKGVFPGRDNDGLYVGAYAAMRNNRLVAQQAAESPADDYAAVTQYGEYGVNIAYSVGLTPWLSVNPNLEYIINPGAFSGTKIHNATVLGVQTNVIF